MKYVNVILFFAIIFAGLISYFIGPVQKISYEEKRKLAAFPEFEMDKYLKGHFTDSIDEYMDDHFIFRKFWIDAASKIRWARGIHPKNQEKVFRSRGNLAKNPDAGLPQSSDTVPAYLDIEAEYSGDMLIIDGSVFPMGGGSPAMGKAFARMVNDYAEKFKGKVRIFSAVAPLSSAFIPVEKYRYLNGQNKRTLQAIGDNLNGAYFCDVFKYLNDHSSEKLFFSTDHHWTANGAFHAYQAFCSAAGFKAVQREEMDKKTKYGFLGTLYERTRDQSVRNNADTFVYYIPKTSSTAVRYDAYGYKPIKSNTFCHGSRGGMSYSTFLCGDNPLMKITTNNKNGKKVVVIKNSMGNAFSVYLISHYEEVWVMDFRYAKQNLAELIEVNEIDDVVFAIGMYGAMSSGTIGMMRRLLTQTGSAPPPAPVPSEPDTSAVVPANVEIKDTLE
ncbi:MAG: DHHW family protein [Bacteroidota bacterium]